MNVRLIELARKREGLVARSAAQREQLSGLVRQLERPLAIADKGMTAARFVRAHPMVFAGGGAVAAFLIGRRLGGLHKIAGMLWGGWKILSHTRSWWSGGPR
jgi:hypothetical protein